MEKRKQHYKLADIQAQMVDIANLHLTNTAREGLFELGFSNDDAVNAIQALTIKDFYKSMTTYKNHKVWQDVYNSSFKDVELYIKFQSHRAGYFFTISFKESGL